MSSICAIGAPSPRRGMSLNVRVYPPGRPCVARHDLGEEFFQNFLVVQLRRTQAARVQVVCARGA